MKIDDDRLKRLKNERSFVLLVMRGGKRSAIQAAMDGMPRELVAQSIVNLRLVFDAGRAKLRYLNDAIEAIENGEE